MTLFRRGIIAGTIATAEMSYWMMKLKRFLPAERNRALPPQQITTHVMKSAGISLKEPEKTLLTNLNHFLYGAGLGGIFGLLMEPFPKINTTRSGVIFGLGVWAGSYLGWLPALNILPPATKQSFQRNVLMISAHLVWGASLGYFLRKKDIVEHFQASDHVLSA